MTIAASPSGPSGVSNWSTIFADDFNTGALDTTKWFPGGVSTGTASRYTAGFNHTGTPPTPAGNYQVYDSTNPTVSGTVLTLTCEAVPGGGTVTADPTVSGTGTVYNYVSGCVTTTPNGAGGTSQPGFTFFPETRTVIEGVIKVPAGGTGLWPAWWTSSRYTWTYEVDVFEFYASSTQPQQNIHYRSGGALTNNAQAGPHVATLPDLSTAFHTYTADINTNGVGNVDFYIDGTYITSFTEVGYATAEMLLILNLALDSASPTTLPATMQIDSVAVYQPEPSVTSVVVAPLDANNKILPAARDNVSAVFTAAQTASTLQNGLTHRFDCTSGAISQSLPSGPSNGTTIGFKRMDSVNTSSLTITASGSDVIEATPFTKSSLTVSFDCVITLVYNSGVWTATVGMTDLTSFTGLRFSPATVYLDSYATADLSAGTDGAMTSGAATLTTASALTVGQCVVVAGAGTSGADLYSTVSSVGTGHVSLAANAATTVSGASFWYGTDNTAAITSALTAAFTLGQTYGKCTLICQPRGYGIGTGPTTGPHSEYACIPFPWRADGTSPNVEILVCSSEQTGINRVKWSVGEPSGTVFMPLFQGPSSFSTSTGLPAVFGGPASFGPNSVSTFQFNSISMRFRDITIRQRPNPTMTGIDAGLIDSFGMERCVFDTTDLGVTSTTLPTHPWAWGVQLPVVNTRGPIPAVSGNYALGMYCGFSLGELLTSSGRLESQNCAVAIALTPTYHLNHISFLTVVNCIRTFAQINPASGIVAPTTGGNAPFTWLPSGMSWAGILKVDAWDIQHATSGSFAVAYDCDDTNAQFRIEALFSLSGGVPFLLNNAGSCRFTNLNQQPGFISSPPAIPATGVAITNPYYRDTQVFVTLNSNTAISIGSNAIGNPTNFIWPNNKTLTFTYTGTAPTWKLQPLQ